MTGRPVARRPVGHARRTRPVRRASAGLSRARAGAALAMLVAAAAIYGAGASSAFGFSRLDLQGASFTRQADILDRLGLADGANLFGLATEPLEARLRELPTVADASVSVSLPDALVVRLRERVALLIWRVREHGYLVDGDGRLFAAAGATPTGKAAGLPTMTDERAESVGLGVGDRLDPIDLDAATRLGSLRPGQIGSAAAALALEVTDESGFIVRAEPQGWEAVFGFYTPSLRTPDIIPGQVRLLAGLLRDAGESNVERVILASDSDGTYSTPRPVASPHPSATPRPKATARPKATPRPTARPSASAQPSPSPAP